MAAVVDGRTDGYLPIADYGIVGDCRSAALVGNDGSIDWLCLPRFDSPSLFGRLLDAAKGGHWQLAVRDRIRTKQRYRDRTNLLLTTVATPRGLVTITDFMPVSAQTVREHARPHGQPRLVRIVECVAGSVVLDQDFAPAPNYGSTRLDLSTSDGRLLHGDGHGLHVCLRSTVDLTGPHTSLTLEAGDTVAFALRSEQQRQCGPMEWSVDRARELMRETRHYWWQWISRCHYDGHFQEPVWRSALALKLMTYAPTGAIVAAPTTSLPERIGGPRNWDYRFTWLRDAAFTLYAFFQLGLTEEAHGFFDWLVHTGLGGDGARDIPNLFPISGGGSVVERELHHLEGYRKSGPVRVGNAAASQLQLDVYGEVLDSAYLFARFGGEIKAPLWRELRRIVDLAIARWREPDASIWEMRGVAAPFTYSKVMCWVAVDRGLRIAERFGFPHDGVAWKAARRVIHRAVTARGFSQRRQAFAQALDSDVLDAAVLRMSQTRFLDDHDSRMRSTVAAIAADLGVGALVRRYNMAERPDGVAAGGDEGGFLMCSFWLADALAHAGEVEEAQRQFERLLVFGSPLGLFAEEADMRTGELLGNFPQAFTHLSLVGAAVNIERARHRRLGTRGLRRGKPKEPYLSGDHP